jgi:hypothetical protein
VDREKRTDETARCRFPGVLPEAISKAGTAVAGFVEWYG